MYQGSSLPVHYLLDTENVKYKPGRTRVLNTLISRVAKTCKYSKEVNEEAVRR